MKGLVQVRFVLYSVELMSRAYGTWESHAIIDFKMSLQVANSILNSSLNKPGKSHRKTSRGRYFKLVYFDLNQILTWAEAVIFAFGRSLQFPTLVNRDMHLVYTSREL